MLRSNISLLNSSQSFSQILGQDFFPDILNLLYGWLKKDSRASIRLAQTCKTAWGVFCKITEKDRVCGKILLKRGQICIREEMLKEKARISFQAPMSYGKTATALSVAFHQ